MPFPPPPPPPGPPPAFGSGATRTAAVDGDSRNLLLNSIRQGTTLKKAVTNDRSAPVVGELLTFVVSILCGYTVSYLQDFIATLQLLYHFIQLFVTIF